MKHQTGMTGWPSGNILDFRARLPEVWGSNPGGEKRKRNLFLYIYRRYLINALLLYIECVLLIIT